MPLFRPVNDDVYNVLSYLVEHHYTLAVFARLSIRDLARNALQCVHHLTPLFLVGWHLHPKHLCLGLSQAVLNTWAIDKYAADPRSFGPNQAYNGGIYLSPASSTAQDSSSEG